MVHRAIAMPSLKTVKLGDPPFQLTPVEVIVPNDRGLATVKFTDLLSLPEYSTLSTTVAEIVALPLEVGV